MRVRLPISGLRAAVMAATVLAALVGLSGTATVIGTAAIERAHPATGRFVPVTGGVLHVVEKNPPGGAAPNSPVVVLIHGVASNLHDEEYALGERLGQRHRVLLVDRPGHGWSPRGTMPDIASPRRQAALVHEALQRLGVTAIILLGHSWGGTLAAAYAIDYPQDLAGLILLAPVAYPWTGGISWFYELGATPFVGPAFAHIFALPIGYLLAPAAVRAAFAPKDPPENYVERASALLALRPSEFLANGREVAGLKAAVAAQSQHYSNIRTPTVIIAGAADTAVPPRIHAQPLAAGLPNARLVMLPGVGHMPHYAAPDVVAEAVAEIADNFAKGGAGPRP
jgi:pimeloyl-ACP methyl ester carboxylesterase